jgi:UDP-N-acetylglucosamine 2-epimerase (non-hydrolysing)
MAPVVKAFQAERGRFETRVCVTAQHREMLDQVLEIFGIKPDYDLDLMRPNQDLYDISARILLGMKSVLLDFEPELVLVHGDTTTSTMAALSAFYMQIPVGHVEAGLRTHNIYSPWPEEMNRQLTSRIATYHFAPTNLSRENLLGERVPTENIIVTGNTVIDALYLALEKIHESQDILEDIRRRIENSGYPNLYPVERGKRKLIIITGHRRENFGSGFENMCSAIREIALANANFDLIYPVHLNPNVQLPVHKILDGVANVYLIPPLEYLPFIYLLENSYLVLTDSGGIQEEAPSLGKPVLVMRDTTERPEAVEAGTVKLIGTNSHEIVVEVSRLIGDDDYYKKMANAVNPYGDGLASKRIIEFLK